MLKQALQANEQPDFRWEIIVCDNNSTDATAKIAQQAGAKVVSEPINQISRARNTGAAAAVGEWCLFLDADSYPSAALMKEVLLRMSDPAIVGCGSTITVEGDNWFNRLRMERLNPLFRLFNVAGGVFLLCRREAFIAIDGFSTELYALEEFDFIRRLKRYGRRSGQRFIVLHQYPVVTSGRKGSGGVVGLWRLLVGNLAAILWFGLYHVLPRTWFRRVNSLFLGYWYKER